MLVETSPITNEEKTYLLDSVTLPEVRHLIADFYLGI